MMCVPFTTRLMMKLRADDSDLNTAAMVRPPRSRTTTTTWRLPV